MSLVLRGARYRYAGTATASLIDVDLELEPGSVLGVVGANGAGKSTLCLVAAGLAPATIGGRLDGVVTIEGRDTAQERPDALAQRCGILFQNPLTQLSGTSATVWEEVAFGPRNLGLGLPEVVGRVDGALAALAIAHLAERDPTRLSGGQAQLVALAGVLAMRPAYLILDEPTSQLDPLGTRLVADAITAVAAVGDTAVLLVEHKTDLVAAICRTVAVMEEGRIARVGTAAEVLGDERLEGWGVDPPALVRLSRSTAAAGVTLPEGPW